MVDINELNTLVHSDCAITFHYISGEKRRAEPGDWHVRGDFVVINLDGQAPARVAWWAIKRIEMEGQ